MDSFIASQNPTRVFAVVGYGKPKGYQQTSVTAAQNLPNIPASTNHAIVQAETGDLRYTDDGITTPTASVGMYLFAGNYVELQSEQVINNFKFISVSGSAVTVNVSYYHKQT